MMETLCRLNGKNKSRDKKKSVEKYNRFEKTC